ncbi:hypothetical protein ACLGI4_02505 [Streptomyces sp. HMX112]|uniref:hypothetical protein n=1 Tax=Streptomyces sp. HMX112 TaxID=3390850 RepID=UPI003A7FD872
MFKHRRFRVGVVLVVAWVVLAVVERRAEHAPWGDAVPQGLIWASVVAGVWWFAEWTQGRRPGPDRHRRADW